MTQPPAKAKDPMQALLDDLEQSIADFDQRLSDFQADPTATGLRPSKGAFPAIDANANWVPAPTAAKPEATATAPAAPSAPLQPEAPPVDLLAELAEAAASQSANASAAETDCSSDKEDSNKTEHPATDATGRREPCNVYPCDRGWTGVGHHAAAARQLPGGLGYAVATLLRGSLHRGAPGTKGQRSTGY